MAKKLLILGALIAGYLGATLLLQPKLREVLRVPSAVPSNNSIPATRNLDQGNAEFVAYQCVQGKTAFDLLQSKTNHQIEVKDYSFGKMIQAINGVKGEANGKFWLYFVDGKSATVSADNYHCQDQEKVEWKFIKPE